MSRRLVEQVSEVLDEAETLVADEDREHVRTARDRLVGPLRVALVGKVKAGKSTLLNALVGERLAPTDASECTQVVTRYRNGPYYRVRAFTTSGDEVELPFERGAKELQFQLGELSADDIWYVDVEWPTRRLEDLILIDTPGLASASRVRSVRTERFLQGDDQRVEADAVIYLMRHLHPMDLSFLEAFADGMAESWASINSIAVLSRADEIGTARLNAMHHARHVASRYRRDPRIRAVAQVVTPVAGLVAQAAPTLTQRRVKMLDEVAHDEDRTSLLLSAQRFRDGRSLSSTREDREAALSELGLYGVRLGSELLATSDSSSVGHVSSELERESGIDELRQLLAGRFSGRAQVLKARTALTTVHVLAQQLGGETGRRLSGRIRDVERSAHDLVEIQALGLLATGEHSLGDAALEAERLLGGEGPGHAARLGLDQSADQRELRSAATLAAHRWRETAQDQLGLRNDRTIAGVVTRTCEGIVHDPQPGDRADLESMIG